MVAGLGRAGRSAALALAEWVGGDSVTAWDASCGSRVAEVARELSLRGIRSVLGDDGTALLDAGPAPGCIVKSPGIHPDAPLVRAALERGTAVMDEAEIGWRLDARPVVGVTGTNGKSTVCALVAAVLDGAGHTPVVAGNTAFGPALSGLQGNEADVVVAELSSFQLAGSPELLPDVAVLTNLSDDHWEHHGGRERYGAAKRAMFVRGDRCVKRAAVNADDEFGEALARRLRSMGATVVTFGQGDADVRVVGDRWTFTHGRVELAVGAVTTAVETRLPGPHNAMNVAAAVALTRALELDVGDALHAIARAEPVAGRFELVDEGQPFHAIVDYAHNPAGIGAVLATVRGADLTPPVERVLVVTSGLTALGDRQHLEAARALAGADEIVLSVERFAPADPHDPPAGLLDGLRANGAAVTVVPDRRKAIRHALARARPNDSVLMLNRGVRRSPTLDSTDRPYSVDDRDETRTAIRELRS